MADLNEYPANLAPQDALTIRSQETPDSHAVVPYSAEQLLRPALGPANPFKSTSHSTAVSSLSVKRKNVPTGTAEETFVSEHTFRSKHRAIERRDGNPGRDSGRDIKEVAARLRENRQSKGDASIVDGDGAYVGPWARYKRDEWEEVAEGEELRSDEEYEYVTDEEGQNKDDIVESGTVVSAPGVALQKRQEDEELGPETTTFHGSEEFDYQGRTYMHVPQDLGMDLRKEAGSTTNYIPKKLIHTWKKHGGQAITGLRFLPNSGHLLLSSGADATVKIWDVYHHRELLRSYHGHSKAVSDICFNVGGTRFLSASYDRQMKLWDTETGACISRFSTGKTPHVIRFSPDPSLSHEFVAGMSDKKIVQFDTRIPTTTSSSKDALVQEYDHHLAAINTIEFVDQGRRFITTSDDRSLRAWDYGIPVPIKYVAEPDMFPLVRSACHPGGKYVVYQSGDNQVLVYSAGDKFRQNRKKSFRGHNNAGSAVDLECSPDGQFLASGDTAGYVVFWDWKTCKMFHKIKASEGTVGCVRWHPQEPSKFVSGGADGIIKYWD